MVLFLEKYKLIITVMKQRNYFGYMHVNMDFVSELPLFLSHLKDMCFMKNCKFEVILPIIVRMALEKQKYPASRGLF